MCKFVWLVFVLFFISSNLWAQQAWTRKSGELYSQIGASWIGYGELLNGNETLLPVWRNVSDLTIQAYGTYGLNDWLTLNANIPLKIVSTSQEANTSSYLSLDTILEAGGLVGLSNSQIGASFGILQKGSFVMAAHFHFDLGTAISQENTGLQTGSSSWGFIPSLGLGYGHQHFFASTEFGSNIRTNGYSTQLFSRTQLGTTIAKKLYIILTFDALFALNNGSFEDLNAKHTGLYLNHLQYQAPGLKLGWAITPNWGVWLGAGGLAIAGGKDLGAAPSFSLSVYYKKSPAGE